MLIKFEILFLYLACLTLPVQAQLKINEFMASNTRTLPDEHGEFDDWIEIFNAGQVTINLSGYSLTDNLNDPKKWPFPDLSLMPDDFLLIWADNNTEQGNTLRIIYIKSPRQNTKPSDLFLYASCNISLNIPQTKSKQH